jgi:hypothetical protein
MENERKINSCRCGSKKTPIADSDDMIPCWIIECLDCNQKQHSENSNWSFYNALVKWNKENPIVVEKKVLWLEMKKYINQMFAEDKFLQRKDLLKHLKDFNSEQSIDKLRCYLTRAEFLEKSVGTGIYLVLKPIPLELTQTKLIEIAYP